MVEKLTEEIHTLSYTLSTRMLYMSCQCFIMDGCHAFQAYHFMMAQYTRDSIYSLHLCQSVGIPALIGLIQKTDSCMIQVFIKLG